MLSQDERRRIEAEELAAVQARQAEEQLAQQRLAAHAYRQEVRAALRPRPFWWPVRWALPFVPVAALAVVLAGRAAPPPAALDDATGGITSAELVSRCREAVSAALPWPEADLSFPTLREAAGGISANADGKRWDAQVGRPDGTQTDFTCTFTAADGSAHVDILEAP
ncbi:hypothetical protein [Deinococcus koreensis]|uniref:Uncharacterized protein n=1 Tax=Deinococcus koreensis TaxID=2054903 RepID=A0A2K3UWC7_9DEIO|nr:hypothetical protein [Deinococcus koreensis]PNY80821.1 hypothetical protein CVO96_05050 [Deinococcus koreensis]